MVRLDLTCHIFHANTYSNIILLMIDLLRRVVPGACGINLFLYNACSSTRILKDDCY